MSTTASGSAAATTRLRSRLFTSVVIGWTFENIADSLLMVIFGVWIVSLTGNPGYASMTFAVFGLAALSAPFLGHIADRVSRRRMFTVMCLVGAVALVPLLFLDRPSQFWWIYVSAAVYAAASFGAAGTRSGLLRDMLIDDDLGKANSLLQSIDQVLRLTLPFAAAAVYAWVGPKLIIGIAIACFLIAALVFALLHLTESAPDNDDTESFWPSVTAGLAFLAKTRALARTTRAIVLVSCTLALTSSVGFAVLQRTGVNTVWMGPIEAVSGLGGLAAGITAAMLMTRIGHPKLIAIGIPMVGIGAAPLLGDNVWLFAAGLTIIGLGYTWAVIAYVTQIQIATPARLQGRVSTTANMLLQLPSVVITTAGAALLGLIDAHWIVAAGIVMSAIAFTVALIGAAFERSGYRFRRPPDVNLTRGS